MTLKVPGWSGSSDCGAIVTRTGRLRPSAQHSFPVESSSTRSAIDGRAPSTASNSMISSSVLLRMSAAV